MISIIKGHALSAFAFAAVLTSAFMFAPSAHAATNLITNGDFSNSSTSTNIAQGWTKGGYDNNGQFAAYTNFSIIAGKNGGTDKAAQVVVNNAAFSGDAKWIFDATSTTPGALYTFADSYTSNTNSYYVVAMSYSDNPTVQNHFMQVAILSATSTWARATADFSIPKPDAGQPYPVSMTVYHLIKGMGTLATDNYTLTAFENTSNDLFAKPLISLSFDDGWTTQYNEAFKSLKNNNIAGTFYIISNPLLAASYDFFADPNESIVPSTKVNSATWSPIYTDPSNTMHRFAVTYTSTSSVSVVATYNGGTTTVGTLQAGNGVRGSLVFTLPTVTNGATTSTVTPIAITMTSVSGTLTATNPVLNEYSEEGYMSADQLKDINAAGNEIGAHTVSHCSLLTLTACAFPLPTIGNASTEISSSSAQILSVSGLAATTLAYPYGDYNSTIEGYAATGLKGARSVDFGYNRVTTDKYALKSQSVNASTTVAEVQSWIDTAIANKFWLILTFHQIDTPANILKNGEDTGTTPDTLNAIIAYIKGKGNAVDVKTVAQGLDVMAGTVVTPVDTTAPIITLTGVASTSVTVGTSYTDAGATAVDQPGSVSTAIVTTVTFGGVATSSVNTNVIGTYVVHYNATDTAGNHATEVTRTVNVIAAPVVIVTTPVPVEITPAAGALTAGTVNALYSQAFTASTSASGIFVWSVASGMLPAGLSLTSTGLNALISGTSTEATSSSFSIKVTNSTVATTTAYTLVINAAAPVDPSCNGNQTLNTTTHTCVDNAPAPAPVSYGGGGGGGAPISGPGSIGYVNNNNANSNWISIPGAVLGASTNCFVFTQSLAVGSTGTEVTQLQTRLTLDGFFSAGATGYFGSVTKASVMAYQAKNGLDMVGNVGPKTRAALNASCSAGTTSTAPAATSTSPALGSSSFTLNLSVGSTGSQVTLLQKVLIDLGFLKIDAPTAYFGTATRAAVMGYQTSRGIEAVGSVGPQTRAALNSNQAAK